MARRLIWPKAVRWGIGVFVLAGLATWFLAKPDPQATPRQQICQSWGVTDAEVLAKCRQSREQVSAAIEPFKRSAVERDIAEFNDDLSALASGKTHANDTNYPNRSIEEVEKVVGGMWGLIIGPKGGATIPAKGQPAKLFGVIITHEPDRTIALKSGHRSRGILLWRLRRRRRAPQSCQRQSTSISNR
jgi:hypothetical protein